MNEPSVCVSASTWPLNFKQSLFSLALRFRQNFLSAQTTPDSACPSLREGVACQYSSHKGVGFQLRYDEGVCMRDRYIHACHDSRFEAQLR